VSIVDRKLSYLCILSVSATVVSIVLFYIAQFSQSAARILINDLLTYFFLTIFYTRLLCHYYKTLISGLQFCPAYYEIFGCHLIIV